MSKQLNSLAMMMAAVLMGTLPALSQAQDSEPAPWYRVELVVFTQPGNHLNDENWDTSLLPSVSENVIQLENVDAEPSIKDVQQGSELPVATSLMRKQGYEIIYSRSWDQEMLPREQTRPIRIQGGERINDGFHQLDGEISLDIARYLHLRTRLFYTLAVSRDWLNSHQRSAAVETEVPANAQVFNYDETASLDATVDPQDQLASSDFPGMLTLKMEQGRRMRGGELHYVDHPYFGLVIRLTRLETQPASNLETPIPVEAPSVETSSLETPSNNSTEPTVAEEPTSN